MIVYIYSDALLKAFSFERSVIHRWETLPGLTIILSSAKAFNMDKPKHLSYGKGLKPQNDS